MRSLARLRLVHPFRTTEARADQDRTPTADLGGKSPYAERDRLREAYLRIDRRYTPAPYAHPITLLWAQDDPEPAAEAAERWKRVAPQLELHVIPGTHLASLTEGIQLLAGHVTRCLR